MPGRKTPIVTHEIYHVFNRGINRQPTFTDKKEYQRAKWAIYFYQYSKPPLSLSKFLSLEDQRKQDMLNLLKKSTKQVGILSYCLMPNHFHILLTQQEEGGIAKFLSNFQNSYTRYFNKKHQRDGSIFLDQFKAVRAENDEQFVHLTRYIHLNPFTAYVVKTLKELEQYQWCSFKDYLEGDDQIVDSELVMKFFKNINEYRKFVLDQANYQRELKRIEHMLLE